MSKEVITTVIIKKTSGHLMTICVFVTYSVKILTAVKASTTINNQEIRRTFAIFCEM